MPWRGGIAHGWVDLAEVNEPKDREGRRRDRGAERNRWEHVIGSIATTAATTASSSPHSPAGGKCQLSPFFLHLCSDLNGDIQRRQSCENEGRDMT
jgi:hypothetical protein